MIKRIYFRITLVLTFLISAIFNVVYSQHTLLEQVSVFNSYADEQNPILTKDGKTLYFTRAHHANNVGGRGDLGDIWYSTLDEASNKWMQPKNIGYLLNNRYHNGGIGFGDNNWFYVYNIYEADGRAPRSRGVSYSTPLEPPAKWTIPETTGIKYYYNVADTRGVSISRDGKIMLLSIESFKTRGNEDIYVSFWIPEAEMWSAPKNLGSQINTKNQELTPYLASDNKTLYFASNGHGGFGSKDIFTSQRLDDNWTNWSTPKNLGAEINTRGSELYYQYIPDQEIAIYTSTTSSDGYGDLRVKHYPKPEMEKIIGYKMDIPNESVNPALDHTEEKYFVELVGEILESRFEMTTVADITIKGGNNYNESVTSGLAYSFQIPAAGIYEVSVEAKGHIPKKHIFDITTNDPNKIEYNFVLDPIRVGTTVQMENVLFQRGTTDLLESSYSDLELVISMMSDNPSMIIALSGHTDNQGNSKLNKKLSQERVDKVVTYLESKGIGSKRLSGKGFGGAKPIASNSSEETRKLNRRVEFTIEQR